MIQRFIELGEGYSDLYELTEIMKTNKKRLQKVLCLHVKQEDNTFASFIAVLEPAEEGNFQPLYICREGIPVGSKRYDMIVDHAKQLDKSLITFDVKHSSEFAEVSLYFQYLIGILRLNYLIPPLL